MKNTSKWLILLCAINYFLSATPIRAQEAVSLVVSPPNTQVEGKPGDVIQKNVKVTNNSDTAELVLRVYVKDFIVQDDAGTPIPVSKTTAGHYLASPWFTLEKSEIVIPAKSTEQIVVLITVPSDALPGGHYASVFFEPVPGRGLKNTVSYTTSQVGALFAINVPGDIKFDALIKEFKTKINVFEFGPIDFTAVIENQSDTHISPKSTITIHDTLGRQVAEIPLEDVNIFPFTSRTLSGTWETVWGLGRYTATLSAAYGPSDLVASHTISFWIMPYRLLAAIGVILLVLLAIFISVRRHLLHRADHRDDEIDELKHKISELENNVH